MVRAEGCLHTPHPAPPRHQEYQAGTNPASLYLAKCVKLSGRELQYCSDYYTRAGFGWDTGIIYITDIKIGLFAVKSEIYILKIIDFLHEVLFLCSDWYIYDE